MKNFAKGALVGWFITVLVFLFVGTAFAYNPHSFYDEETLNITGRRPKVDIILSEITVNISPEDFVNGVFEKIVTITNNGNVPCRLRLEIQNVPVDLVVKADVDTDFLTRGESTNLNIYVELTDMQEAEDFNFKILVEASLR